MGQTDDYDRLIQEALVELGREGGAREIADKVQQLDLGLPAEDEFTAVCSWLGKTVLIHKLDQQQAPLKSRDKYQVPDLLAQFDSTGPFAHRGQGQEGTDPVLQARLSRTA